ncbi:MAG: hypothetical protein R3292_06040 [Alcanivorax sp.]|nr:hypothetical protein [Alcanivorax sp.]
MQIKHLVPAIAVSTLLSAGSAFAATDGNLNVGVGASSQGSIGITLNVPDMIKLSGLTDLTLANSGTGDYTGSENVCVFRNLTGKYSVTAQSLNDSAGAGTAGNFVLSDGAGSTVQYGVTWDGSSLSEDTTQTGLTSTNTSDVNCSTSTPNVALAVTATAAQVAQATASGAHTDTLTLTIAAE